MTTLETVFATKLGMSQAWTTAGRRLAVTKCRVDRNQVIGLHSPHRPSARPTHSLSALPNSSSPTQPNYQIFQIGFGLKKLANMPKPLRSQVIRSGFSLGVKKIQGVRVPLDQAQTDENAAHQSLAQLKVGQTIRVDEVLSVGDVVKVQGTTKGRGFAGAV